MRRIVTVALVCVLAAVACVSGYKIFQIMSEYRVGETTYDDLKQYVSTTATEAKKAEKKPPKSIVDFDELSKINSDVVAWIKLDDSVIDYPVAQCDDNDYYLKHLFNKQENSSGSIFLDYRNNPDFSDRNSVIYGHHMKNGSMFSAITKYKEQSFFDEHPIFKLYTPDASYKIRIFSGYVADLEDSAWNTYFEDDVEFEKWLDDQIHKSLFNSKVKPTSSDKIVTLSTCSYEFDNARFVVCGVITD
ncbi:MAG: class B sortase [Ruminococcus sp.]|nr:class B sortase [Ruminococcus sp.]